MVSGREKTLLVHRKGSTRAFPPHHPLIPVDYQVIISKIMIGAYSLSLSLSLSLALPVNWSACTDWWYNGNLQVSICESAVAMAIVVVAVGDVVVAMVIVFPFAAMC